MNKLERLTAEILLLQERKRGSEELAELLEVSKRTIIRDIQALCEMGVPVIARDGVSGGYSLPEEYSIQPIQLSWKEMLLLMLALGSLSKMADAPFAAERHSLMSKIEALLPDRHRERVDGLLQKLEMQVPDRAQRSPMLECLVSHLELGHWVRLSYRSGGPKFEVVVKPLRILADRGFWYLRAYAEGEERSYRVDRIEAVSECKAPEQPMKADEALPYNHPSHPHLRVRLSAKGIRRVENDQHLYPLVADVEPPATIEFHCPPSELDWYAKFFGEMADDAVVEGPPELIARILDRNRRIFEIYEKSLER